MASTSEDLNEAGLALPRPTESGSDVGAGSSNSATVTPSTSQNLVSSGMLTPLSQDICLTAPPQNADNSVSDPTQAVTTKAKRPKPWDRILNRNTVTNEPKSDSNLGSTIYASTKVVVDVVKESTDVFPPLKSVMGGLSAILKHYDVC